LQLTDKNVKIISMSGLSSKPYKGTRDYYPSDKRLQNYIFAVWKQVSESYGYEEYGAPTLEPLELYAAKSGEELVNEQTYAFVDRGGRKVAIRPEMTPTISRMVADRRQEMSYPARLYSIANFMRYERPQRGREREFWQLNVDIFGDDSVVAEAEMVMMASDIMTAFGAKHDDYIIRVNNRKLINYMMAGYLALDEDRALRMVKLLDRKDKMERDVFMAAANEIFGDDASEGVSKLEKILDAKSMAGLPQEILQSSAVEEVRGLFTTIEHAGIKNAVFDITLMRGFDYYTGMVFEVFDTHPDNRRALFGGGRYDGLVGLFGVEPLSAVGFAPGGSMFELFLETHGLLPQDVSSTDAVVVALDGQLAQVIKICGELRKQGLNIELTHSAKKLDRVIKTAVKKSIAYVAFVGERELASGLVTLKDIVKNQEYNLDVASAAAMIKEKKHEK
jgi:histidyl-tRNA synthetase